jgi:hypothetical protein
LSKQYRSWSILQTVLSSSLKARREDCLLHPSDLSCWTSVCPHCSHCFGCILDPYDVSSWMFKGFVNFSNSVEMESQKYWIMDLRSNGGNCIYCTSPDRDYLIFPELWLQRDDKVNACFLMHDGIQP